MPVLPNVANPAPTKPTNTLNRDRDYGDEANAYYDMQKQFVSEQLAQGKGIIPFPFSLFYSQDAKGLEEYLHSFLHDFAPKPLRNASQEEEAQHNAIVQAALEGSLDAILAANKFPVDLTFEKVSSLRTEVENNLGNLPAPQAPQSARQPSQGTPAAQL